VSPVSPPIIASCFSTTGDVRLEDRILKGVDTLIKPWKPPADDATPFKSLVKVAKAYTPGQGNIDGGGFKVVKETDNYLYMQFEGARRRRSPRHSRGPPERATPSAAHRAPMASVCCCPRSAQEGIY
jgi:hypothetical protein